MDFPRCWKVVEIPTVIGGKISVVAEHHGKLVQINDHNHPEYYITGRLRFTNNLRGRDVLGSDVLDRYMLDVGDRVLTLWYKHLEEMLVEDELSSIGL